MSAAYFALIGTSNENGAEVRWTTTVYKSESDIIALAEEECERSGEDLEFIAGFELLGLNKRGGRSCDQFIWSRDWMPGEKLKTSLIKLNDDGRAHWTYNHTKQEEVQEFLTKAEALGLGENARALVAEYSPNFAPSVA
ncbi:hypothetical protein [Propionivibrio limicola]|uniref:hypothetical protein n=1 Tax=Propionivibrio limicola TaxID=167645 RepID=UPI0012926681|nr:hypothetical protein [Propionivibrio limicola]